MILIVVLTLLSSALFAAERKVYVVRNGDTLSDIVVTLRLEKVDVSKLQDWNPDLGMHTILPGQQIVYFTSDVPLPAISKSQATSETQKWVDAFNQQQALHEKHQARINLFFVLLFVVLSVGGLILYGVHMLRDRKVQSMAVRGPAPRKLKGTDLRRDQVNDPFLLLDSNIHIASLEIDPDKFSTASYSPIGGEDAPFLIFITLNCGLIAPCIIQKLPGFDPLVFHTLEDYGSSGRKPNASWKNRAKKAADLRQLPGTARLKQSQELIH